MAVGDITGRAYCCIAELWCNPQDVDMEKAMIEAGEVAGLESVDQEVGTSLAKFLKAGPLSEEEYIEMFELSPKCALYLGSYGFDEPETCAQAAVSDRNEYMIELNAIYKHFGLEIDGTELPDYLPLMIEFLSLETHGRDVALRTKFIEEYMQPYLPAMRSKLEGLESQYLHLLDTVQSILNLDLDNAKVGGCTP
jgi:nitrate reductase delta subunit